MESGRGGDRGRHGGGVEGASVAALTLVKAFESAVVSHAQPLCHSVCGPRRRYLTGDERNRGGRRGAVGEPDWIGPGRGGPVAVQAVGLVEGQLHRRIGAGALLRLHRHQRVVRVVAAQLRAGFRAGPKEEELGGVSREEQEEQGVEAGGQGLKEQQH